MVSNEKFCLRWNDFESNISLAFREIREEKDFFDCTLSCGSRQIQAHKLILTACSPFFRSILRQNPHQHPLLYLKGVEFTDLQSVLNFMYHGEVSVAQEDLNTFLTVAEDLQVKGLTQNSSFHPTPEPNLKPLAPALNKTLPSKELQTPPLQKLPCLIVPPPSKPAYAPQLEDIEEIHPMPVVKSEPQMAPVTRKEGGMIETMAMEVASMEESYVEDGYDDYGGYGGQQEYYEGDEGQGYEQTEQNKGQSNSFDPINNQILEDPQGLGYTCALCGKGFGLNRRHCRRHIKNFHNQSNAVLTCDVCQKCYKNKDSLRHHQRVTHGLYKQ